MSIDYKRLTILALTGILLGTTPASYASAEETNVITEEVNAEETVIDDVVTETVSDNTTTEDITETVSEGTAKEESPKNKKESEKVNYKEEILTITKEKFVADSLNGVSALYRKGGNDGSNSTYSCAAFIKRYYKEVHGVTVMNLFGGRTPSSSEGKFKSVKKPQVGDIVACSSTSGSSHWALVKKVNDNNTVTLIEQNWKWSQGGQTVCKINRTISISSARFYRLYK